MAVIDLGTDVSTFPDLDKTGRTISDNLALAECCLRRLTTDEGSLDYDLDFGRNLSELLNEDLDERELRREEALAAQQLELDERIATASVTLSLDRSAMKLTVKVTGELVTGRTFDFVASVNALSAELLQVN